MSSQDSEGESYVDDYLANPKVVNGQRIKHYIPGNPINVETNIIETMTPEEYITDTF